jgi:hypothetical protein
MTVIFHPLEIFGRLNAQNTVFYDWNILHAVLKVESSRRNSQNAVIRSILKKNDRNFLPFGDISTFQRPKYCILRLEHTARCIKSRIKPNKLVKRGHSFDFVEK